VKPAEFAYVRPKALAGAIDDLMRSPDSARVIAGGQSLGPLMNLRLAQPKQVVDISRIDTLRGAAIDGDVLAIGACVTHAQIEDGELPDVTSGLLPHIARGIAYRAVRNRGTIGGSLAHADPAADWLITMIALDASLRLQGGGGQRQLKVSDFVTGALTTAIAAGEVITHVLVPRLSKTARWGHAKYAKKAGDFAESAAIAIVDGERDVSRVVLGRRAEPPALLRGTSAQLAGHATKDSIAAALEADLRELDVQSDDWTMHRAIVLRAVRQAVP
jgi:aerobic carbon-monoxide dehydrogenase medium subunit